jgi:glyoxylase I family protein
MSRMQFSHVALNCRDPHATERFYTRHFGFQRARAVPLGDSEILFLKNGDGVYLELFQGKGQPPGGAAENDGPAHAGGLRHIAFQVDDVDAAVAGLGADAQVSLGPFSFDDFIPGWRAVWLRDPDGNIVEISQGYRDQTEQPHDVAAAAEASA